MLVDTGFQLSPLYTAAGFTAHSLADGLFMLEAAISGKHKSAMPAIVRSDAYNPDALLRTNTAAAPKMYLRLTAG